MAITGSFVCEVLSYACLYLYYVIGLIAASLSLLVLIWVPIALRFFRAQRWLEMKATISGHLFFETIGCHVSYWFMADGTNITGSNVFLDEKYGTRALCSALDKMEPPRNLPGLYNPEDFSKNCLYPWIDTVSLAFMALSILLFFLSGIFWLNVLNGAWWRRVLGERAVRVLAVLCRLPAAAYSFFMGGLVVGVAVTSIRIGNKIAGLSLFLGFIMVLIGFLCLWISARCPGSEKENLEFIGDYEPAGADGFDGLEFGAC